MDETQANNIIEENDAEFNDLKKKSSNAILIALVAVLSVVVVVLGIVLIQVSSKAKDAAASPADSSVISGTDTTATDTAGQEAAAYVPTVSYTYDDAAHFTPALLSAEIASCAGSTLTNDTLCYYYWQSFYTFMNYYGYYAYYFMDPTARLDSQQATAELSMDQYFMEYALSDFQLHAIFYEMANNDPDFVVPEDTREDLDTMKETLETSALSNGYTNADEYLQVSFGPYATYESYEKYITMYLVADAYYAQYVTENVDSLTFTEEELSAYYDENAETYTSNGVAKDDTRPINVRHILIQPESVTLSAEDEGYAAAVEAAKAAAKEKAEELLAQWLAGDMTEESFAALATENTQDPGSAETGGLYEDVKPGDMVDTFNDWCFDASCQVGDYGIVETSYGYHIMYLSGISETLYWQTVVTSDMQDAKYYELIDALKEEVPMTSDLSNAAVYPCNIY